MMVTAARNTNATEAPMTTTAHAALIADITATIEEARHELAEADLVNLFAARDAIAADRAISFRDVLNVLVPPPATPDMTAAQAARLAQVHADATAAGSTITHRVTDSGHVLVTDTYDGETVTATIAPDGDLQL
jgi:hypothetical protein